MYFNMQWVYPLMLLDRLNFIYGQYFKSLFPDVLHVYNDDPNKAMYFYEVTELINCLWY